MVWLLMAIAAMIGALPALAQEKTGWSPPTNIYQAASVALMSAASDRQGNVHLVWASVLPDQGRDSASSLLYSRLHNGEWSKPVDIHVNADMPQLVAGPDARLHLVFRSANGLAYSHAPVDAAGSAQDWSAPRPIGYREPVVGEIGMVAGPDGALHVAATDGGSGDVYYFRSPDMGETWLEPVRVGEATVMAGGADAHVAVGENGVVHLVWTLVPYPEGYPPQGVYYAQSADGESWSAPLQLAGPDYGQIAVAADTANNVHIVYNGRVGVGGKYHRWSGDGIQWTEPVAVVVEGTGGLNSVPTLLADGAAGVHLLAGTGGNVWYQAWDGANWTAVQDLRMLMPETSESTERAILTLASGNQLHAFFGSYTTEIGTIWHTERTLDLPAHAALPYPTATPPPSPTVHPAATQSALAATPTQIALGAAPPAWSSSAGSVYLALLPALLLVMAVAGVQFVRRKR